MQCWEMLDPERFGNVLDSFSEGVYLTNHEGLTLGINKSYEQITGIKASQVVGRYMRDIVADGILSVSITQQVIDSGKEITDDQRTYNGTRHIITGKPIHNREGKIILVMTVVRNVELIDSLQLQLDKLRTIACMYKRQLQAIEQGLQYVAQSDAFRKVISLAHKVANVEATVLILGESGTGKEIVAREIHEQSFRAKYPFLKVNCGTIPENLLESELFGYEKGAFTGALASGHIGLFETADKGTVLLDEIGDLPLVLQVKLLRVLQEKTITRVGGSREIRINTRIVAATHENLEQLVAEKKFRKDLYYRLNVVRIEIPPLRDRPEEIPALIDFFVDRINSKYSLQKKLHPELVRRLIEYDWPGNVRELENVIERMLVTADKQVIGCDSLQLNLRDRASIADNLFTISGIIPMQEAYCMVEEYLLKEAAKKHKTMSKVASALRISQPSVSRKVRKYRLHM